MTDQRIISISAAPYDGHPVETALASLASIGATHVEPAFIVGYTEPFDESAFLPVQVHYWNNALKKAGLACHAMSTHIDLGMDDSVEVFTGRMAFAAGIGARIVCTNAAARSRENVFYRNMEKLLRRAEAFEILIGLENPGDGSQSLLDTATDGIDVVRRLGSDYVGLNYDAANTVSHRPTLPDPAADAISALPASVHAHIKDVARTPLGYEFRPLTEGDVRCDAILDALRDYPALPISIELPLRLSRGLDAKPIRGADPVPLSDIEAKLAKSLVVVRDRLA